MMNVVTGLTPEEVAQSATAVFRQLEDSLRPHLVEEVPSNTNIELTEFGELRVGRFTSSPTRVRLFSRLIDTDGEPQWREFMQTAIDEPFKIEINNAWDMTNDGESALIIEQSGSGDASIEFQDPVNRFSIGVRQGTTNNPTGFDSPFTIWKEHQTSGARALIAVFDYDETDEEARLGVGALGGIPECAFHVHAGGTVSELVAGTQAAVVAKFQNSGTGDAMVEWEVGDTATWWQAGIDHNYGGTAKWVIYEESTERLSIEASTGAAVINGSLTATTLNMTGLTASRLVATDGSKNLASADLASWVTGTANEVTVTDDLDGTITLSLPTGIDAAKLADGSVSSTEFQYLNGVTSAIQTQLDGKAPDDATYIVQTADGELGSAQVLASLATGLVKNTTTTGVLSIATASDMPTGIDAANIADGSVSNTKFQYLGSVTSDIQTQINADAPDDATYIVQTADGELGSAQALGALATGIVKNTTTTGVLSIAAADTDFQQVVTWGDGLQYSAPTASVDYNTTNLKITSGEIDTIQSIATSASPTFTGLTLSGDLLVNGLNIGITADADLMALAANKLTLNGDLQVKGSGNGDVTIAGVRKATVAAAGTAVVDVDISYGQAIVEIWATVYLGSNNATSWQGQLIATITNNNTGTDVSKTEWHQDGAIAADVTDFVFSRPGSGVLRMTYTNSSGVSHGCYFTCRISHWSNALTSVTIA